MKCFALISVIGILLSLAIVGSADVSACRDLGHATANFTCSNFAGFYYDADHHICTESLFLRFSNIAPDKSKATLSGQPDQIGMRGITYTTKAHPKNFGFRPWGQYEVIEFLGMPYIAAYDNVQTPAMAAAGETVPFIAGQSNNANLIASGQICRVLMDNGTAIGITSNSPLNLMEGYQLAVKSIDVKGGKLYLELSKNGQVVDSKVIRPSITDAKMADRTYYYKKSIGGSQGIVTIAVHFRPNIIQISGIGKIVYIDGVYQISDTPISIDIGQQYDKLTIESIHAASMEITMDNKDNPVTLSSNKYIPLIGKLYIRTANQNIIGAQHPLKYCLCKKA